jgi:4-hydroxybenzoate polyprenyltransferase
MQYFHKASSFFKALRPTQWIKNLVVFTAILFAGQLFQPVFVWRSFIGFIVLCILSSTSYLLNDVVDYQLDRKHPVKRLRPIASGAITIPDATFAIFILALVGLLISLFVSIGFFLLMLVFLVLHFFYSLSFKKRPLFDIFTISFSFMIRTYAGTILTGYHIQIWLMLTIFFVSLFIASVKRDAELSLHGMETRTSLYFYKEHLLEFLTTTFATLTIVSYSLYTFLENPPLVNTYLSQYLSGLLPNFEARKWFMITIPLVIYGIARYAQLLYERTEGEQPEKIITKDKPLIVTIGLWALIVVFLIYIF